MKFCTSFGDGWENNPHTVCARFAVTVAHGSYTLSLFLINERCSSVVKLTFIFHTISLLYAIILKMKILIIPFLLYIPETSEDAYESGKVSTAI